MTADAFLFVTISHTQDEKYGKVGGKGGKSENKCLFDLLLWLLKTKEIS